MANEQNTKNKELIEQLLKMMGEPEKSIPVLDNTPQGSDMRLKAELVETLKEHQKMIKTNTMITFINLLISSILFVAFIIMVIVVASK